MSDPLTPQQRRDMNLREEGAALERKRIVAWLNKQQVYYIADAIERLDHLRQPEGEA